ncbi:hypothetical protein [Streptomyces sp. NPDC047525]|uniref:hypothetical protein n=1 Tax=Streptomyces sp. NPDC047525 TaxID=3155264 RepID=UPI0033DC9E33
MRFSSVSGPFCQPCGTSIFRDLSGKTLWQGWWSPLSLVLFTPATLIVNRVALARLNKLPPPIPGQPGPQLMLGVPVLRRLSSLAAVVPLVWAIWMIARIANGTA